MLLLAFVCVIRDLTLLICTVLIICMFFHLFPVVQLPVDPCFRVVCSCLLYMRTNVVLVFIHMSRAWLEEAMLNYVYSTVNTNETVLYQMYFSSHVCDLTMQRSQNVLYKKSYFFEATLPTPILVQL